MDEHIVDDSIRDDESDAPSAAPPLRETWTPSPAPASPPAAPSGPVPEHVAARQRYEARMKDKTDPYWKLMHRDHEKAADALMQDLRVALAGEKAERLKGRVVGDFVRPEPPPLLLRDAIVPREPMRYVLEGDWDDDLVLAGQAYGKAVGEPGAVATVFEIMKHERFIGATKYRDTDGAARGREELTRELGAARAEDTIQMATTIKDDFPPPLRAAIDQEFGLNPPLYKFLASMARQMIRNAAAQREDRSP